MSAPGNICADARAARRAGYGYRIRGVGLFGRLHIFSVYPALLISVWWCLSIVIIRSDLDNLYNTQLGDGWHRSYGYVLPCCFDAGNSHAFIHDGRRDWSADRTSHCDISRVAAFAWVFARITGRESLASVT